MDDQAEFLYNPAEPDKLQTRFPEGYLPGNHRFAVKNLILRGQRPYEVRSARGFEQWIFFQYYTPTPRGREAHSMTRLTPENAFEIIAPGTPIFHGRNSPWMRSLMSFEGSGIASLIRQQRIPKNTLIRLPSPTLTEQAITLMHRECTHPGGARVENIEAILRLWLGHLSRCIHAEGSKPMPERLIQIRTHIESHFAEPLRIADLARQYGVSSSWLSHQFREHFHTSVGDYILRLRIELAKELLTDLELNLDHVAERSGFSSVYYFSNQFLKRVGTRPSVWRRQL